MGDLIKPTEENIKDIQTYFKDRYALFLSPEEAKEVYVSLYYLGKALHRYKNLKKGINHA